MDVANGIEMTIVVPQYGETELTLNLLRSLRSAETLRWPVIIVDDGTEPDTFFQFETELVHSGLHEQVRLIRQPQSGVTAAWNRGAYEVTTQYVLFLNNDVIINQKCLNRIPMALAEVPARLIGFRERQEAVVTESTQELNPSNRFLEGWGLACRTEDYFQLGGFDEKMILYFSDTDFQLRLLKEFGEKSLHLLSEMPLTHLGHRTAHRLPEKSQIWRKDREVFLAKWKR